MSKVVTAPCRFCGVIEMVDVPTLGWIRWRNGELIQDALPDLPVEIRELLLSGTHLVCWDLHADDED